MVMPRMLSLSAVQKQSAISRSIRPKRIEQQGLIAGAPRFKLMRLRIFAHVESLSWSLGQVFSATTRGMRLRKRRLITRNIATMVKVFAAIYISLQENIGILTDIPTENEILGISRGIS